MRSLASGGDGMGRAASGTTGRRRGASSDFDAIVVGGGHNG
jgi:hypothetical protein